MDHKTLWNAIEKLAKIHGLSFSGLAKISGLDATTFNKSKQFSSDGTPRWPSCQTISKILEATHVSPLEFAKIMLIKDYPAIYPSKKDVRKRTCKKATSCKNLG